MRVVVVTPPAPVVTWEQAKAALGLEGYDDRKVDIERMIAGHTSSIDGPDGSLGRCIGLQTLDAYLDAFDGPIRLPYPPVTSVLSITYINTIGVSTILSGYDRFGAILQPSFGTTWPSTRSQSEAVRIRYQAGYSTIPSSIMSAIILMVRDELNGEPEASAKSIKRLLNGSQVYA